MASPSEHSAQAETHRHRHPAALWPGVTVKAAEVCPDCQVPGARAGLSPGKCLGGRWPRSREGGRPRPRPARSTCEYRGRWSTGAESGAGPWELWARWTSVQHAECSQPLERGVGSTRVFGKFGSRSNARPPWTPGRPWPSGRGKDIHGPCHGCRSRTQNGPSGWAVLRVSALRGAERPVRGGC